MAGNIVKWWKHKILGGYKQFSVQECTTDSEELMYHQVRAPSSCSAPPDLLLVSDRENNIPLKSPVVNIITATTTTTATTAGCSQSHQQQQQHHQTTKELFSKNAQNTKISSSKNSSKFINMQTTAALQQNQQQQNEANQQQQQQQTQQHQSRHHGKEEQRIHLEEFTCDVSVEGGKSTQPLQFSFTFYDLDGHHGKITKDDIVGIVYTIYESIGKSVVVPHCGSKTINVRLTVSPEGKSKATANKLKKMQPNGMPGLDNNCKANNTTTTSAAAVQAGHSRRQHRYRPRKLIKSDDEDDDSTSEKDLQLTAMAAAATASASAANKSKSHASKYNNRMKLEQQQQHQQQQQMTTASSNCCPSTTENNRNLENNMEMSASSCQHDNNLYENVATNLKCCTTKDSKKCENSSSLTTGEECRGCVGNNVTTTSTTTMAGMQHKTTDMYLKQASSRVKMLRKARKQKYQDHCLETRQRSLSVGSETCWKSRYARNSTLLMDTLTPATQQRLYQQQQQQQQTLGEDVVDGVQLRNPHRLGAANFMSASKRSSADCWKTALNRSELISIIRESMEKNRLCFQLNGKPQASVSPIRQSQQRQRSNTVSKIPTLIANHNNFITNCNNSSNIQPHHTNTNNSLHNKDSNMHDSHTNYQQHHQQQQQQQQLQQQPHQHPQHHLHHSHHHPQPHIPIYHQQMAINPAVLAAQNGIVHSKMNLCGYDSFLHATICGGGTSHSPPPPQPPATVAFLTTHTQQPVATVQPIMNAINAAAATVPNIQYQQQQQQPYYQVPSPKIYAHPTTTTQQIKTSKILRSGTFSQTHHHAASAAAASSPLIQHSSTQYHGYHRLASATASATKHNLAALNSQNPSMAKAQVEHLEKWLLEREQCAVSAVKSQKTKKDVKNYDNLLFAKLAEKLQDSTLNVEQSEKQRQEAGQRRKQRAYLKAQKRNSIAESGAHYSSVLPKSHSQQQKMIVSPVTSEQSNYAALIPINGDPIECENLLSNQTSDEDTSAEAAKPTAAAVAAVKTAAESAAKQVDATLTVTGDLLDFTEENDTVAIAPNAATGRDSSNSNSSGAAMVATCDGSAANNCSNSASLIHRYVHEHIHHHYHHFEEKEE